MQILKKTCEWANRSVWHFVPVVGIGAYGIALGTGLALYLIGVGHLPIGLGLLVAYALSAGAGLIFGTGIWYVSVREQKKVAHE